MYILYITVLKIKLITNLHALSVAIHVLSNNVICLLSSLGLHPSILFDAANLSKFHYFILAHLYYQSLCAKEMGTFFGRYITVIFELQ